MRASAARSSSPPIYILQAYTYTYILSLHRRRLNEALSRSLVLSRSAIHLHVGGDRARHARAQAGYVRMPLGAALRCQSACRLRRGRTPLRERERERERARVLDRERKREKERKERESAEFLSRGGFLSSVRSLQ